MKQNNSLIIIIIVLIVALIVCLAFLFLGRGNPDIRTTGEQIHLNGDGTNGDIMKEDVEESMMEDEEPNK